MLPPNTKLQPLRAAAKSTCFYFFAPTQIDGRPELYSFSGEHNRMGSQTTALKRSGDNCCQGGVFWTKGEVIIRGGVFADNIVSDKGGVMALSEECNVTLLDGRFEGNEAGGRGGVVSFEPGAKLMVKGGEYSANEANTTGGAFSVAEDGDIEVRGDRAARRSRGRPRTCYLPTAFSFRRTWSFF